MTTPTPLIEVTQADRDAAAALMNSETYIDAEDVARVFARHREATNARLIRERDEVREATLNDIAVMMSEFVDNWPNPKKVSTALALIAKTMRIALDKEEPLTCPRAVPPLRYCIDCPDDERCELPGRFDAALARGETL